MRFKRGVSRVLMLSTLAAFAAFPSWAGAEEEDLSAILEPLNKRIDAYQDPGSYAASAVTTVTKMDEDWKPKEIERSRKRVTQRGGIRREDVLEATVTKDGKTTDITAEYRKDNRKRSEKANAKVEGRADDEGGQEGHGALSMTKKELFPFGPEDRKDFIVSREPDASFEGRPVYILRTRARTPSKKLYEGAYYVDRDTYDVLFAEVRPSRNPRMVREMQFKLGFEVLPGDRPMVRSFWMRLHVNAIIKKIRFEVDERYSDFRVPAGDEEAWEKDWK